MTADRLIRVVLRVVLDVLARRGNGAGKTATPEQKRAARESSRRARGALRILRRFGRF